MTDIPDWVRELGERADTAGADAFSRFGVPEEGGRDAAVLILLADDDGDPDVLVLERAANMRSHAGQPAFPGGAADPGDGGPEQTALREASEEVGLKPGTVTVVTSLPQLWIPVSNFVVTPVLAWWHSPHPLTTLQPEEVARVARLKLADLADPANRLRVRHPSGWIGPAFAVGGLVVWGFTAGILTVLLDLAGLTRPWDRSRIENLPVR